MNYTPTPWKVFEGKENEGKSTSKAIVDQTGIVLANIWNRGTKPAQQAKANAEFIVRAVNSHEELLEACKDALKFMDGTDVGRNLEEAIAKAEGSNAIDT